MRAKSEPKPKRPCPGGAAERRHTDRFATELPVLVHGKDGELFGGITRDVCAGGLYLTVRRDSTPEANVRFLLTFPREIAGSCRVMASCLGTIVRREIGENMEGWALHIDRFEFLRAIE